MFGRGWCEGEGEWHASGRHGRRHHRGGPFRGFGGPGDFWSFGRFPFGRGPRARRGDIRAAILALLAEGPRNGYQIMQELEERSRGAWRPSPGSVYPALQQLEDEGLIRDEASGGGRTFSLTSEGRAYIESHPDEVRAPWEELSSEAEEAGGEMFGSLRDIALAAWQVSQAGTPAQLAEAEKLLREVKRGLYRILAGEAGRKA
ncbi:MAG TPA: PadR family transcriptional regulator [Vicinamibacteria bacterium]